MPEAKAHPAQQKLMEAIHDLNLDLLTHMPRPAKVGHKKSRLGCQRCKSRRVKCDEQKPVCGSCHRHGADCVYIDVPRSLTTPDDSADNRGRRRSQGLPRKSPSPVDDMFPINIMDSDDTEASESRARRMMELRLTQNFLSNFLRPPLETINDPLSYNHQFQEHFLTLCLKFDNVLFASHALSATQLLGSGDADPSIFSARQNYYVLALREQRRQCAVINEDNAEAVIMCSLLISQMSFAMLRERDLSIYSPPIEWLRMGRGANAVLWKAINLMTGENPWYKPFTTIFQNTAIEWQRRNRFDEPFEDLWNVIQEERPSPMDQAAYCQALDRVNKLKEIVDAGERTFMLERRIQSFPVVMSPHFAALAETMDEYALVILAHYFAVVSQVEMSFWWMKHLPSKPPGIKEGISAREIEAISAYLGPEFGHLLAWPLEKAFAASGSSLFDDLQVY